MSNQTRVGNGGARSRSALQPECSSIGKVNANEVIALQTAPADNRRLCVAVRKHQASSWSMLSGQAHFIRTAGSSRSPTEHTAKGATDTLSTWTRLPIATLALLQTMVTNNL